MLLWVVTSRCWLPGSPAVVTTLANAMIRTCRELELAAKADSQTRGAARLLGDKGKGGKGPKGGENNNDRFYHLYKRYLALRSALEEGWRLYNQALAEATAEATAAEGGVLEVTRWIPGPGCTGWRNVDLRDVCAAPGPHPLPT